MKASATISDIGTRPKNQTQKKQTRTALIKAAINIFGRDGFAAASTRSIADEAGVNQALINYHFRTKQGLYLAVFEYINAFIQERMGQVLIEIEDHLGSDSAIDKDFYWQSIKQLLGGLLQVINSTETKDWSSLIIREQQHPTEAFAIMESGIHGRIRKTINTLVARQMKLDDVSEQAKLISITLLGQILMFKMGRATVLASMNWERISAEELNKIEQCIFSNFASILNIENI